MPRKNAQKRKIAEVIPGKFHEEEEEMFDIDRILDERGRGKTKEYLVSWMDGEKPQWLSGIYLKGTVALEDWKDAEDEVPEVFDEEDVVVSKCNQLIDMMR